MEVSEDQPFEKRIKIESENGQLEPTAEERIISVIRAENQELRGSIESLKRSVTLLAETVASQKELIKELFNRQENGSPQIGSTHFPIKTEDDLFFIDSNMKPDIQIYVNEMKNIFSQSPLSKSLKKVLAVELVLDFNVDGTNNKKCLRTYSNFFSALIEAVRLADSSTPAEKSLRKAMQCIKNNACKRRMRFKKSCHNELEISQD